MAKVFLLRHFPTPWNTQKRIQGRTDIDLSDAALRSLESLDIPAAWHGMPWYSSPLIRSQQTAKLLGATAPKIADKLIEMNWGEFEGLTMKQIEHRIIGQNMEPAAGLDLQPPSGESPRMVIDRLHQWIEQISTNHPMTFAVTHKGVIRAALSLATGWDMLSPFAESIDWSLPLLFNIDSSAKLSLVQANCDWHNTDLLLL